MLFTELQIIDKLRVMDMVLHVPYDWYCLIKIIVLYINLNNSNTI